MIILGEKGESLRRRAAGGQSLVEMAIAIGLSGFLVLMLSGMLSQTMLLSTTSQNELIAAQAAEELLENARVMTYSQITNLISTSVITPGQSINFIVNANGTTSQTQLRPTSMPVQLDLTNATTVYGEVNPSSSSLVNTATRWVPGFGNYFLGTATETVTGPINSGAVSWYEITVQISYNGTYADSSNAANTKQLTRTAYVVNQGLNLQ
jgi:hypothetical protein